MRTLYYIGFFGNDLEALIKHLEETEYDKTEVERLKAALKANEE